MDKINDYTEDEPIQQLSDINFVKFSLWKIVIPSVLLIRMGPSQLYMIHYIKVKLRYTI